MQKDKFQLPQLNKSKSVIGNNNNSNNYNQSSIKIRNIVSISQLKYKLNYAKKRFNINKRICNK